jgi:hypothetical protein
VLSRLCCSCVGHRCLCCVDDWFIEFLIVLVISKVGFVLLCHIWDVVDYDVITLRTGNLNI